MKRLEHPLVGILITLSTPAAAESGRDVPVFDEVAEVAGISQTYNGPWEYFVGGGVAAFDCDADRRPELFIAGGEGPAQLYLNRSRTGGELRFVPHDPGIRAQDLHRVLGAYPLDIDNDAIIDLVLLRVSENLVLRGLGECRFEKINRQWGIDGGRSWTTAFAATFEAGYTFPTMAFGNYVDRSAPGSPWGTCDDNILLRPTAAEGPDYSEYLTLTPGHCALSLLFTDWNRSGEPALRVSNDRHYYREGQEQLWRLAAGRPPRLFGSGDGWRPLKIWGMGIAQADLNADGYPEYALTSMGDTKLQRLHQDAEGDRPLYEDIAYSLGVTAHRPYTGGDKRPSTGWHSQFEDLNNDGLVDMFITKGNVEAMEDFADYDPDNLLLGGWDERFTEFGDRAGVALNRRGRGAVVVDLNLDGMLDIVVVNRAAPASVFRNRGASIGPRYRLLGNWLAVDLEQDDANRDAVGATVTIRIGNRTIVRTRQIGGGHASDQLGWMHAGLGTAERATVRIQWPDGAWSHPYQVFANQFVIIRRGEERATYWYPD